MNIKYGIITGVATLVMTTVASADVVEVTVEPGVAQHYGAVESLQREKFFCLHESNSNISKSDMADLKRLGVTQGRTTQSPFAGSSVLKGVSDAEIRAAAKKWYDGFLKRGITPTKSIMEGTIIVSHPTPKDSAGGKYAFAWKGEGADYSDEAKFAERWFRIMYQENGLNVPTYYEPMNEPFVKAGHYDGINNNKVITEMCRYHQQMAAHLKPIFPEMKVGGFGGAWPFFEGFNSDFVHWERRMKQYIDIAGKDSDFLSIHIYDGCNMMGEDTNRSGSNMEALLDIMEGYTTIKFGTPKPILISEHGLTHNGMTGAPYTRERDWRIIRSWNHQSMQFMLRPANMEKVVPFVLFTALWGQQNGHPYPWVLRRKDGKGGWLKTDLYKYFEFWSDLRGDYIFSESTDVDVLSLALSSGDKLRVVLNNLEEDRDVKVSLGKAVGGKLKSLTLRSIYGENGETKITERDITEADLEKLRLRLGETVMITAKYSKNLKQKQVLNSKRYYATTYLKSIKAGKREDFEINIDKGEIERATLKIAFARAITSTLKPELKVGDKLYEFPTDWKGYDQKSRTKEGFFGTVDVVVDPADIGEKTQISLTFPEDGGTISTVGIDVNYR